MAAPTFDEVAARIAAAEHELEEAGRPLSDPETYRDADRIKLLRSQYDDASERLEELYALLETVNESPSP